MTPKIISSIPIVFRWFVVSCEISNESQTSHQATSMFSIYDFFFVSFAYFEIPEAAQDQNGFSQ